MADTTEAKIIDAPRIEVAFIVAEDGTLDDGPYEGYLILHAPDGKWPTPVLLDGGPWDRVAAVMLIETIFTAIGEKFAPTRCVRATGLERHMT